MRNAPPPAASVVPEQLLIGATVVSPLAVRHGVKPLPPRIQCESGTELLEKDSVKMGVPTAWARVPPNAATPMIDTLTPSRRVTAR
jgi:hypothetical protein